MLQETREEIERLAELVETDRTRRFNMFAYFCNIARLDNQEALKQFANTCDQSPGENRDAQTSVCLAGYAVFGAFESEERDTFLRLSIPNVPERARHILKLDAQPAMAKLLFTPPTPMPVTRAHAVRTLRLLAKSSELNWALAA